MRCYIVALMAEDFKGEVLETLTLRFTGENKDGTTLHELKANHVADVLHGLVELTRDFENAGALGVNGPSGAEILVRPAKEGSFIIEIVRLAIENHEAVATIGASTGIPTLSNVIWWATKSARAELKDYERQDNGMVKVIWQDDAVQEVPEAAFNELQKRTRRRKKQLKQIMAPMNDMRVDSLELSDPGAKDPDSQEAPEKKVLTRGDYIAVTPTDEVEETEEIFEAEAQMSTINFDDPHKWRVKARGETRNATVEDEYFLKRVENGLAIRKTDIFTLRMREDTVVKNGRSSKTWTVLVVSGHRRASGDDDTETNTETEN